MVYVRSGEHYFKYGMPVRWVTPFGCYRLWIFGMSEIIEMKCSGWVVLRRTPLVQPVAKATHRGHGNTYQNATHKGHGDTHQTDCKTKRR